MVRTGLGQRLDNAALVGAHQQVPSERLNDAFFLEKINGPNFILVLMIIIGIGALRRRYWLGLTAAAGVLLAVAGVEFLKRVALGRPFLVSSDAVFPVNSFPSGHTAIAIACALALVIVTPPSLRGLSAVAAGTYAWITAADVQTAGWHRSSDAIGAAFIAFAVMALAAAALAKTRRVRTGQRLLHIPAFLVFAAVWVYTALKSAINAARVIHYLNTHAATQAPTTAIFNDAYQFNLNMTILVVVSLLVALLVLLRNYDLDAPRSTG
jgi:membrane-associated phospholipid phosphatase